jgi:threonine dehydrogenase-like Zn-dependent dehydrogenase
MGAWHYNLRDFPAVMQVVQHSPLIEQLVSHTFPMRQVQEAFACSAGQASAKILLQPWA